MHFIRHITPALAAPIAALALAVPAPAQTLPMPAIEAEPVVASPFSFAQSGEKEKLAEEKRTEAESAGGRIIGGKIAEDGAWPWQVALMLGGQEVNAANQFCGGSLITDQWVLTAAHCVHFQDDQGWFDLHPSQVSILVGTNRLMPGEGDLVPVAGIYRYPDYNPDGFDSDIALIKLARRPNAEFRTIQIPTEDFGEALDQSGVPTYIMGWGLINGAQNPDVMYDAEIQMLNRDQCNGALMEARAQVAVQPFIQALSVFNIKGQPAEEAWSELVRRAPSPMTDNMLCSGTFEGGKLSCQGDSGGPLVVPLTDGSFVQAGIVSWGLASGPKMTCVENALFSAYTKVSRFNGWIDQTLASN